MLSIQRQQKIISYIISSHGSAKVSDLAKVLQAGSSTIRRDLDMLESEGRIRRVHGGAVICHDMDEASALSNEAFILPRSPVSSDEKRRIGQAAAGLVQDSETIIVTSGTTTEAMIPFLQNKTTLSVITNALNVACKLSAYPQIAVVVLGGWLRHSEFSLLGHLVEQALQDLHADRLFHGVYGIDLEYGLTGTFLPDVQTDRRIIAAASEFILLADHTKFGRVGPVRLAPIEAISTIVTGIEAPSREIEALRARGITVLQV